ncbi:MAG: phosphatidate cytidylyltransferase [Clostridia bacterium]|nr:phosphatidate cytidylyltransferase [Clostridia bacterium]
MNLKRIISSLVGLPIVILVFLSGNIHVIDIAISIIAVISMYEYLNSFKSTQKAKPISWICYLACLIIAVLHFIPSEYLIYIIAIFVPLAILSLFLHIIITDLKINIMYIAVTIFGICYVVLFYAFIPMIYGMENGKFYIWYTMLAAWGTDVFAYSIGRRIGKHKFSKISPNKSIEGCIAGTVGAIVLSIIYTFVLNKFFNYNINYLIILVISLVLSLVGQVGDFSASSIKRYTGIKDFGKLIPGHGGMLDRFDSLIFIAPFAYFLLMLI